MLKIKISEDYTKTPGGRYIGDGDFSGQEFRDKILYPQYMQAIANNEKVQVDFDDCFGFPASFIEEAFGGLVRKINDSNIDEIINRFEFISDDEPSLVSEVKDDMKNALLKVRNK